MSTGVPCEEVGDAGRRKALSVAQKWAEGLDMEYVPKEGEHDLSRWCEDRISARLASGLIERSTYRGYSTSLGYISQHFSGKTVEGVTAEDVESFVTWMAEDMGLCQNTVKKTYNVLSSCMRQALQARVIQWDPCAAVRPPRQRNPAPNPLTEQSRRVFVARMRELEPTPEVMGTWMAYYTGARRGEVCGLKWSDVSLGDATATVRRSIGTGKGGSYEKGTKSGKERVVPLPSQLVALLSRRRNDMMESCFAVGVPFSPDLYVLGDIDGSWLNPWRLSKWWTQHRDEWGLMGTQGKPPVFHDLRHTYATIVVRETDVRTAQQIMGHSDVNMTMRYADTPLEHVREAGRNMSRALDAPKSSVERLNPAETA